jgi:hypothetical protein
MADYDAIKYLNSIKHKTQVQIHKKIIKGKLYWKWHTFDSENLVRLGSD